MAKIRKLTASPARADALAKLQAAQSLHLREVDAWTSAFAALSRRDCGSYIGFLRAAARAGAPGWADGYTGVRDIAGLYGQDGSVSHQTPYAQQLG